MRRFIYSFSSSLNLNKITNNEKVMKWMNLQIVGCQMEILIFTFVKMFIFRWECDSMFKLSQTVAEGTLGREFRLKKILKGMRIFLNKSPSLETSHWIIISICNEKYFYFRMIMMFLWWMLLYESRCFQLRCLHTQKYFVKIIKQERKK